MTRWGILGSVAPAAVLLVLLVPLVSADPAAGITFSNSPFTDEGWNAMGARNLVLLGDPGAGNWVLHLAQLPFTALEATSFALFGVGIVQARLVGIACTVASVGVLGLLVRRALGPAEGLVAAAALGGSTLLLYYGHLAYLEDLVMLALLAAAWLATRPGASTGWFRWVLTGALLAVAVGSKPSAAFAAAGILLGVLAVARDRSSMRMALVAMGTIAASGLAWAALVTLTNPGAIGTVLEIWAEETAPSGIGELLDRITSLPAADGFGWLTLPLAVAGLGGLIAVAATWKRLGPGQRRLAAAAIGWLVMGVAVLAVVSYRPNRYAVPLLPPLAILAAYLVAPAASLARRHGRHGLAAAVAPVAVIAMTLPGIIAYAGWMTTSSHDLPQVQQQFLQTMDGLPIEGGVASVLAMRVPAPIYVDWTTSDINDGDLYARHGVRWIVGGADFTPEWAGQHLDAWRAREALFCVPWGHAERCLIRIP